MSAALKSSMLSLSAWGQNPVLRTLSERVMQLTILPDREACGTSAGT